MTDLEIPFKKDRTLHYRIFEILPGALSWSLLLLPLILSIINVTVAAVFVLVYLLINFTRIVAGGIRALQGFHVLQDHMKMDWLSMLEELEAGEIADPNVRRHRWHHDAVR